MPAQLDIWNQACAEIYTGSVASLTEKSVEANYCNTFYAPTVLELLEVDHAWSFANKRVVLASLTNDRGAEWAYAYALPSDCARPRRILPDLSGVTASQAYWGPWGEWPYRGLPWDDGLGRFYDLEAGTIYSWFENATLEYTSNVFNEAKFTSLFARAVSLALAAKISSPIKKDRNLKGDLIKQAEVALQRAIAADANRQPQDDCGYEPEAGRARGCC